MRELLRAKEIDTGKIKDVVELCEYSIVLGEKSGGEEKQTTLFLDQVEIQRCSGIKDINKELIYQGDGVKFSIGEKVHYGIVCFERGCFVVRENNEDIYADLLHDWEGCELITPEEEMYLPYIAPSQAE